MGGRKSIKHSGDGKKTPLAPKRKIKTMAEILKEAPDHMAVTDIAHNHKNDMVDLETWGKGAGYGIISIGAVSFGPNGLGPEFYCIIDRASCRKYALREDPETISWWMDKPDEAKEVLLLTETDQAIDLREALLDFNEYLSQFGPSVRLWGNGSDFDNAILQYAYEACGLEPYWKFWNNESYRTLKNLPLVLSDWHVMDEEDKQKLRSLAKIPKSDRVGTYHNALDDAKTQALHAIKLLNAAHV